MAQKPCRQSQRLFQRKSRDPSCRAFPRHAYVVEGQYAVADDLPLFMPLASQQDNVVSTRLSNRRRNRLPTTADFDSAGGRRHDGPADVSGVFGTGIVICDDDMIGKIHRDLTHFRPLTCVPVAASPENHDQAAFGVRAQRLDGGVKAVGRMSIIDINGRASLVDDGAFQRSEEHTSELQSLMRNSYA